MFAVLAAGIVGYALGGWLGVAVGACSATAVTVLLEPLTPPGDRETAHERRMRRSRRYRARYESLEDAWRRPYQPRRTTWAPVAGPIEVLAALETPAPAPAPALPAQATPKKRPSRAASARTPKAAKPRDVSAQPRGTGRKPRAAPSPRPTSGRSSDD